MATVRTSLSSTLVNLFGTVSSTASMVCKAIDSAASSVDMLDRYVQDAKTAQVEAHTIAASVRRSNLILDTGRDQEKRLTAIQKEYAGDAARQQRFNSVVAELEALFLPQTA